MGNTSTVKCRTPDSATLDHKMLGPTYFWTIEKSVGILLVKSKGVPE
jgi:hypothetical protein